MEANKGVWRLVSHHQSCCRSSLLAVLSVVDEQERCVDEVEQIESLHDEEVELVKAWESTGIVASVGESWHCQTGCPCVLVSQI